MSTPNNNPKGILLILVGMAIFSIQDALIKFVFEDTALYELYFGRTLTALILLLLFLKFTNQKLILKAHYPYLAVFRVVCFFFGFSFFYISLTFMSLAMANALFFSSPFFISISSIIVSAFDLFNPFTLKSDNDGNSTIAISILALPSTTFVK